jgi:hypothetical protein
VPSQSGDEPLLDRLGRPVLLLGLAAFAVVVLYFSFTAAIATVLDGSGGPGFALVVFVLAALVLLATTLLALRNFTRARARVLSALTIVVGLVPVLTIAIFAALTSGPPPEG